MGIFDMEDLFYIVGFLFCFAFVIYLIIEFVKTHRKIKNLKQVNVLIRRHLLLDKMGLIETRDIKMLELIDVSGPYSDIHSFTEI